jgi:hypothetical protein
MKLSRPFGIVLAAGIGVILVVLVVVVLAFPSSNLPATPTIFPTLNVIRTSTRESSPVAAPTKNPTRTPTNAAVLAATTAPTAAATLTPTTAMTFTATATPSRTAVPTLAAVLPNPVSQATATAGIPSSIGFSLLYSTPVTTIGGTTQVTISTTPGVDCTLTVYDPRGRILQASGMEAKKAGVDGRCTWIWVMPTTEFKGTGYYRINANGMTQTFIFTLQ